MAEICAFHVFQLEMHKTADFHSNLLVSWELMTGGYLGRPMKCISGISMKWVTQRPLPGIIGGSTLADGRRTPPQGSRFFRFDMQNFQNVTASGAHAPPTRSTPPLREILDPPLGMITIFELVIEDIDVQGFWHLKLQLMLTL